MLHVEGRDPAGGGAGLADRDADVDEEVEVDLVAAEALRHEAAEDAGRLQRLDHVVVGLALLLGVGGALGDERHDRADAREQPLRGQVFGRAGDAALARGSSGCVVLRRASCARPSRRKRTRGDRVVGDERPREVTHLELQAVRIPEVDRLRPALVVDRAAHLHAVALRGARLMRSEVVLGLGVEGEVVDARREAEPLLMPASKSFG